MTQPERPELQEPKLQDETRKVPRSKEEERVWKLLEAARQTAKASAKREIAGELIGEETLNLRLG